MRLELFNKIRNFSLKSKSKGFLIKKIRVLFLSKNIFMSLFHLYRVYNAYCCKFRTVQNVFSKIISLGIPATTANKSGWNLLLENVQNTNNPVPRREIGFDACHNQVSHRNDIVSNVIGAVWLDRYDVIIEYLMDFMMDSPFLYNIGKIEIKHWPEKETGSSISRRNFCNRHVVSQNLYVKQVIHIILN